MSKDELCKEMPYFMWKIDDIFSPQRFKSPIFTIGRVKFLMIYNPIISSDLLEIYMEPDIEDPKSTLPSYCIESSISIVRPDKECGDLRFTQKTKSDNTNREGNNLRHVLWLLRKKELLYSCDRIEEGRNEVNNVTFLCVFGQLSKYQTDVVEEDGTWCKEQCLWGLGEDLDRQRSIANPAILLKCGEEEIKAHDFILSVRSQKFADRPILRQEFSDKILKKKPIETVEITGMKFEVLENFITYIYNGRLQCGSKPTEDLLIQLYKAAVEYMVDPLKEMVSFKLLEKINDPIFVCSCSIADREDLSSIPAIADMEVLSECSHSVKKCEFGNRKYLKCKKMFTSSVLCILLMAHLDNNKTFKEKIMFSVAKNYDFILNTSEWHDFRDENIPLTSEVYAVYIDYTRKYYNIP